MPRLVPTLIFLLACAGAQAQDTSGSSSTTTEQIAPGGESTMAQLLSQGYEVKAAVPNGVKFVVFLQKDQSAYACEFSSVSRSRCGAIN